MKGKIHVMLLLLLLVYRLAAQDPGRYDVVIHEILADPTPSRGMPATEFVEIRNRSGSDWNLRNWALSTGSATGRINQSFILKPDSLVILCTSSAATAFQAYGATVAMTSFPSLDNDGDTLVLMSPTGNVIHALAWDKSWYRDDVKEDGGWSIEMIDIRRPCLGKENWSASKDPRGGTPGKRNSVAGTITDSVRPFPLYAYMPDSASVVIVFSEPLSELSPASVKTEPQVPVLSALTKPPLFDAALIKISGNIKEGETIVLSITGGSDCSGNAMVAGSCKAGPFSIPQPQDLVLNEILFNPPTGGHDYIEIFNRSNRNIDVGKLQLANRDGNNRIGSITSLRAFPLPLFPGEYLALTTGESWVRNKYLLPDQAQILEVPALPSFPDDQGEVLLLNERAVLVDELNYLDKWHFELISDREGVALERISPNAPTQVAANWHSASTSSGYGTPGYKNSQGESSQAANGTIFLSSKLISPNMDGRDDFLLISYQFPTPGNVASVTVYNDQGRSVRSVARSSLCGTTGFFRWDGMGEAGQQLPTGVYIIVTEYFDIRGQSRRIKKTVGLHQ